MRPRRSLQQWQDLLQEEAANSSAEAGGAPALFNLKESMRWIKGFAPEVPPLLDEHFDKYFTYIQDKHGPHVLACVVFFTLGHHDVCKGVCVSCVCVCVFVSCVCVGCTGHRRETTKQAT